MCVCRTLACAPRDLFRIFPTINGQLPLHRETRSVTAVPFTIFVYIASLVWLLRIWTSFSCVIFQLETAQLRYTLVFAAKTMDCSRYVVNIMYAWRRGRPYGEKQARLKYVFFYVAVKSISWSSFEQHQNKKKERGCWGHPAQDGLGTTCHNGGFFGRLC